MQLGSALNKTVSPTGQGSSEEEVPQACSGVAQCEVVRTVRDEFGVALSARGGPWIKVMLRIVFNVIGCGDSTTGTRFRGNL